MALGEVPGVKITGKLKATQEKPQIVTVDIDPKKGDVGEIAKAVAQTETPHKAQHPPSAALIVPEKGLTKADTEKVRKALAGVKGVEAKEARAEEGQAIVPLSSAGGAHLAEIQKALSKLGSS